MRRGRIFFILAFVLILVLVGILVVWQRVIVPSQRQAAAQATPTPIPVKIVVFAQSLPRGTVLDDTVLTTLPWPADKIIPGMFVEGTISELIGRQIKYDVEAGTPVFAGMLLDEAEQIQMDGSPWALSIPPGMIAVSIPIDRLTSVAYAPRAGDHVDVIASLLFVDLDTDFQTVLPDMAGLVIASGPPNPETKQNDPLTVGITPGLYGRTVIDPVLGQAVYLVPGEPQRPRLVSHTVIQDAIVLQMGDFPLTGAAVKPTQGPQPTPEPNQQQATQAAPKMPVVITLMVRPQDAVTLNYLIYAGSRLSLALRALNDSSRFAISPVTLNFLLDQYQFTVPQRLPYGLNPRLDALPGTEATPVP